MISFSVYLVFFFWILGFYFLWKIPRLESSPGQNVNASNLSVIIPARNETVNLEILLNSLTIQSIPPGEIIVVDDHSEDTTPDIASKAGFRVVRSQSLPEEWAGKPWACWQGAMKASGEILLFLDADTRVHPDGIQRLLATYHRTGGLLSVQPFHHMERWYERLAAVFNIISLAGMNAFTLLGNRIKPIGAFGPCNMCLKKDYFNVGGHKVVRGDILESLGLGKAFLKANLPVHCYGGKGVISFRMYPNGFASMVEGFSKGFGIGAKATTLIGLFLIFCWIFGGAHLTRHLIHSVLYRNVAELVIFAILNILYVFQVHWMLSRIGNFRFITALFFQVPLIFFIIVFFISLYKTFILGRANWKGRSLTIKTE